MAPQQSCSNADPLESRIKDPVEPEEGGPSALPLLAGDGDDEAREAPSLRRSRSFLVEFATSRGPPQIAVLMLILVFSFGSTVGVVPAVTADRYARLFHGYTDEATCSSYTSHPPQACIDGSGDSQNAVAFSSLVSNGLTFFTSSLMGSLSDERGRRGVMIIGISLGMLSPLCLVLLQIFDTMSPVWYYVAHAVTGLVSWLSIAISALSDVMPPQWRAPSFGVLLAGFGLGVALAPTLALMCTQFQVSVLSLSMSGLGLLLALFFLPETLPPEFAAEAVRVRAQEHSSISTQRGKICWVLSRPIREIGILNRSNLFRLLSLLAFFSGMVTNADQTLVIYYLEGQLSFNANDVAHLFLLVGICGILVQMFVLKKLNDLLGERLVLVVGFFFGALNNFLTGIAKNKSTVLLGTICSAVAQVSFPTISAIKSNNVGESEQGRIQGALYSLQSLASALGPVSLRWVYHYTKDGALLGPGTMFVFASFLYLVAIGFALLLPKDKADSRVARTDQTNGEAVTATEEISEEGEGLLGEASAHV